MLSVDEVLKKAKRIAIVGLSDKPERPSYQVAKYLKEKGFEIIPVNPTIESVLGIKSFAKFSDIPTDIKIDVVDIFRRAEQVLPIVEEIVGSGQKPIIWFQEGSESPEAEKLASENGFEIISGICLMMAHQKQANKSQFSD
jgi:predicted CoA-binding protein